MYYQQFGRFDEHLITLYSVAFGIPHLYNDTFILYYDEHRDILYLSLFPLTIESDPLQCLETTTASFQPERLVVTSFTEIQASLRNYHQTNTGFDRDYQIFLPTFDITLQGSKYKDLRYRVLHAKKQGYTYQIERTLSPAHYHIIAQQECRKSVAWWDHQLYLSLHEYFTQFHSPRLFNVYHDNTLIGFDVIDYLKDTLTIPLGFYLPRPSLSDFILYDARAQYTWLDIGWACTPGVEMFKRKWRAIPRFDIWTYEYVFDPDPFDSNAHPFLSPLTPDFITPR
jgi:hypothetical protein